MKKGIKYCIPTHELIFGGTESEILLVAVIDYINIYGCCQYFWLDKI